MRLLGTTLFWLGMTTVALVFGAAAIFALCSLFIHGGIVGKGVVVGTLGVALTALGATIMD